MKEVRATQECQGLLLGKSVRIRSVVGSRNQNPFGCTFINHGAVKVAHCRHPDGVCVALRLDDDLAASYWIGIKGDSIHPTISAGLRDFHLATILGKLLDRKSTR